MNPVVISESPTNDQIKEPRLTVDPVTGVDGVVFYLTWGNQKERPFSRCRIFIPYGISQIGASEIFRRAADQLEADAGDMIRHKEDLFEDHPWFPGIEEMRKINPQKYK